MQNTKCPHCGASMKANEYKLTRGFVVLFHKIAKVVLEKKQNVVDFGESGDLVKYGFSKTEYTVANKLQHWGLIAHVQQDGKNLRGKWLITRLGWAFLKNEASVPMSVYVFRRKTVEKSEQQVTISQFPEVAEHIDFWQKEFDQKIVQGRLL